MRAATFEDLELVAAVHHDEVDVAGSDGVGPFPIEIGQAGNALPAIRDGGGFHEAIIPNPK